MLKSILKLKGVQRIDKESQNLILGGSFLCEEDCIFNLRLCYINRFETFYQPC